MAYTVLARRYRSATFDEVVGQDHVAQTLKKAIASGRIAHAYLFCGTRGVGKTSMARILAKALNCQKADGPTAAPCLKCSSCQAIARGDDIDVVEIDAASNTKVEETRNVILDKAQYRPAHSRFKIYIIDEVHMLSKASFNALLKTLEEPPEHVKFILATTEPEKILPTILSRCQRFDFRNIPTREIGDHLKAIARDEKIKCDEDALMLIARAGAGSMRDALSLLDRVLSLGEKHVTVEMIEQLLGLPKSQVIFDLAQAIGQGKVADVLKQTDQLIASGLAVDSLLSWLSEHFRNLLVIRACGMASGLVQVPGMPPADLEKQASQFDPAVLSQDVAILEELRRQLRSSQAGRALLDATLARLAMSEQFASVAQLLGRAEAATPVAEKKKPIPSTQVGSPAPAYTKPAATAPVANVAPVADADVAGIWPTLLAALPEHGAGNLQPALRMASFLGIASDQAVIRFPAHGETYARTWARNGRKDALGRILSTILQRPIGVRFEVEGDDSPAEVLPVPADAPAAPRYAPPAPPPGLPLAGAGPARPTPEQIEQYRQHPLVKAVMDELGGQILRVSDE
jgi:DNA polymerase-3 subunit gamma/tau